MMGIDAGPSSCGAVKTALCVASGGRDGALVNVCPTLHGNPLIARGPTLHHVLTLCNIRW